MRSHGLTSDDETLAEIRNTHLLSRLDLVALFPGARVGRERFMGLTKWWIVTKNLEGASSPY